MPAPAADLSRWLGDDGAAPPAPPCRYLYHNWDDCPPGHRVPEHQHAFWQIEAVLEGRLRFTVDGRVQLVRAGMGIVVPQGGRHSIIYEAGVNKALTVKFHVERRLPLAGPLQLLHGPRQRPLLLALAGLIPRDQAEDGFAATALAAVAGVLGACVAEAVGDDAAVASPMQGPGWLLTVHREIARARGQPLPVQALAARVGLTASHLAARFRTATGQGLKEAIDQARAAAVARQLAFSDSSLAEIAAAFGFSDGFAFSRFFRRVTGSAPSAFRQRAWSDGR
jgi:AraC family transcriptional regulator, arabinose operon regulatory protein